MGRTTFTTRLACGVLAVLVMQGGAAIGQAPAQTQPARAEAPLLVERQEHAVRETLLGQWTTSVGSKRLTMTFRPDQTFALDDMQGTYRVAGYTLSLSTDATAYSLEFSNEGDTLTLAGGAGKPLVFQRQTQFFSFMSGLFRFSPKAATHKLYRILAIIAAVALARTFIYLVRLTLRWIVLSERGPLAFIYRHHKNRALTIHSLVLNIIKYVVYFTALGFILTELGVNYTTYIASLSVVGLAIGFGSQGLVQDMVTGFFVILEGQFDVGDMVEMSGQTGVVEEVGLRTTRLRNYLGQVVVVPNRNIAVVGRFSGGAQQAHVDVAIAAAGASEGGAPEDVARARQTLQRVGDEIAHQYAGVVLSAPAMEGPITSPAGEPFLRLHVPIWPQQVWVVEQQLMPRVREAFKRENISIPNDRVTAYYQHSERFEAPTWRSTFESLRKRARQVVNIDTRGD